MRAPLDPDEATLNTWTELATRFVAEQLRKVAELPGDNTAGARELAEEFREPLPEHGTELAALLGRLSPAVERTFNTPGPGYMAFIPGGGLPSSALGSYVAASVNRYVGVAKAAPALAEIEATAVRWLAESMGLPRTAGGILTTGGSLSNLTAIVCARIARLGDDFIRAVIYTSRETHASLMKAARIAGFRNDQLRLLPVDEHCRLQPSVLRAAVVDDRRAGLRPFMLNVNAGTTNTGAVDPMRELASVARSEGLWLHADAAYGGFFRWVDPTLVDGLELADSITLDPHKGLFLPYGTGSLLVRDVATLRRAHTIDADYLRDVAPEDGQDNFTDLSPELSRAFRGLALWLPLMLHGAAAFREALSEKLALARHAAQRLSESPAFELLEPPQLSLVAFRLRGGSDDRCARLLDRVNQGGRVFLSSTRVGGRLTLRICVLCFRTHQDRVDAAIDALIREAARS